MSAHPSVPLSEVAARAGALTVRPATLGDVEAICALVNEVDLGDIGVAESGPDEIREDLRGVTDLTRDSWLAWAGDRLVTYGLLWDDYGSERIGIDHHVPRDQLAAGLHVLDLMTARAAEVAAANGAAEAVVHLHLTPNSLLTEEALPARGWRAIRRHHVLTRPVSVEGDPVPTPPAGVTPRPALTDDDQRSVHHVLTTAFRDDWDNHPQTYDAWRERVGADRLDWSLVWIAALDGVDQACCLGINTRETMGWVRGLGTLPAARGKGLASYLLRVAFAEFAARGRHTVGLGVDTENATGALGLYTGLGMTLHFAADTWELRLPVASTGTDPG
ncbi:MAG TPA: GNAT family N-acetyltransferase [Cryptosporangiaceae bacterium]|nr:GNAT family N-acetyltransferase [Cryptosporangiaceae bacterium]